MAENTLNQEQIDKLLNGDVRKESIPPAEEVAGIIVDFLRKRCARHYRIDLEAAQFGRFSDFAGLVSDPVGMVDFRGQVDGVGMVTGASQATSSTLMQAINEALAGRLQVSSRLTGADEFAPGEEVVAISIRFEDAEHLLLIPVDVAGALYSFLQEDSGAPESGPDSISRVEFADLSAEKTTVRKHEFDLIADVPLELTVELGKTVVPLERIMSLDEGTVIELDRMAGDKVDIVLDNRLIAKGEVLVVDDNFAVRITDIVPAEHRVDGGEEA